MNIRASSKKTKVSGPFKLITFGGLALLSVFFVMNRAHSIEDGAATVTPAPVSEKKIPKKVNSVRLIGLSELPKGFVRIQFVIAPPPFLSNGQPKGEITAVKAETPFIEIPAGQNEYEYRAADLPQLLAEPKHTWNYIVVELKTIPDERITQWFISRYSYLNILWTMPMDGDDSKTTDLNVQLPIVLKDGAPYPIEKAWEERFE